MAAKKWFSLDPATSASLKQNFLVVQVVTVGSYFCVKGTHPLSHELNDFSQKELHTQNLTFFYIIEEKQQTIKFCDLDVSF